MTPIFDEGQPNWGHFVRSSNPKSVQSFRGLALKTSEITLTLSFLSTAGRPYHRTHMNTYTHRLLRWVKKRKQRLGISYPGTLMWSFMKIDLVVFSESLYTHTHTHTHTHTYIHTHIHHHSRFDSPSMLKQNLTKCQNWFNVEQTVLNLDEQSAWRFEKTVGHTWEEARRPRSSQVSQNSSYWFNTAIVFTDMKLGCWMFQQFRSSASLHPV